MEASVRDLVAREAQCCSFFTFTVDCVDEGRLLLEVEVLATQVEVLDAVAALAAGTPGVSA